MVSIPLKSGHIVISKWCRKIYGVIVSIPLKSGHIVIEIDGVAVKCRPGFNPLKIGSYCNILQM